MGSGSAFARGGETNICCSDPEQRLAKRHHNQGSPPWFHRLHDMLFGLGGLGASLAPPVK